MLLGAAVATPFAPAATRTRYGAVTIARHAVLCRQGVCLRVYQHGHEVTGCYFADDTGAGIAHRYLTNANGDRYLDPRTHQPATEIVHGITLQAGPPFAWMAHAADQAPTREGSAS